jgi:hypothetical protein
MEIGSRPAGAFWASESGTGSSGCSLGLEMRLEVFGPWRWCRAFAGGLERFLLGGLIPDRGR